MRNDQLVKIFQAINRNVRCPQCGSKYRFDSIKIIGSGESNCLVKLNCPNHLPIVASISVYREQEFTNQDLPAISSDDLILLYQKIKHIRSISELFSRKSF